MNVWLPADGEDNGEERKVSRAVAVRNSKFLGRVTLVPEVECVPVVTGENPS